MQFYNADSSHEPEHGMFFNDNSEMVLLTFLLIQKLEEEANDLIKKSNYRYFKNCFTQEMEKDKPLHRVSMFAERKKNNPHSNRHVGYSHK